MSKPKPAATVAFYLFGSAVFIFFIVPLFWTLSMSLKTIPELFSTKLILWPKVPQWSNYVKVLLNTMILVNIRNSIIITISAVLITLILSIPSSFALSRSRFHGKKFYMFLILVFQMLSPVVVVIPLYRFFISINIYNKLWSLIIVYAATFSPFAVWYLKGYFDTVPAVIDEAARIDGAGRLRTLLSIHMPIAAPGIVSVAILLIVQCWSQFVFPLILLDDKKLFPIPVGLLNLQSSTEAITIHYLAAASIIGILPIMICFIIFQKFIVSGLASGAVKE